MVTAETHTNMEDSHSAEEVQETSLFTPLFVVFANGFLVGTLLINPCITVCDTVLYCLFFIWPWLYIAVTS